MRLSSLVLSSLALAPSLLAQRIPEAASHGTPATAQAVPIGAQIEAGYFLARSHLLSVAARFGVVFSDLSETQVISWQALLRYRFYILGTKKSDIFALYVGGQIGGATIFHSLEVGVPDGLGGTVQKKDTFEHGFVLLGALVGIQIGTQRVAWYLEVDPSGVLPKQSTFHVGLSPGVMLRF